MWHVAWVYMEIMWHVTQASYSPFVFKKEANWPNTQIPECTCSMCSFLFWMEHYGISMDQVHSGICEIGLMAPVERGLCGHTYRLLRSLQEPALQISALFAVYQIDNQVNHEEKKCYKPLMAFQITGNSTVRSTVYSGWLKRKHQSSALLPICVEKNTVDQ